MSYYWLILFAILFIIEICTAAPVSTWYSFGALAAFIVQRLGFGIVGQLVAFLVVSFALLILTKPFVKKIKPEYEPTNLDRLIGKTCIVTEDIDEFSSKGSVVLDGKEWSVLSNTGSISAGERVKVVDIKGVKLIVEKVEGAE